MNNHEIKLHSKTKFPSYMGGWMIPTDICDGLRELFDSTHPMHIQYDKFRQYHRLTSGKIPTLLHVDYVGELNKVFDSYRKKYPWSANSNISRWYLSLPFNLQKYDPNHGYVHEHIEDGGPRVGKYQRYLTFVTYLNDIEEEGQTHFMLHGLKVQPKRGLTVIFPAGWMHPHRGIPAPNETKYIATGWAGFPIRAGEKDSKTPGSFEP